MNRPRSAEMRELLRELRAIAGRGGQVWRLISWRYRVLLGGALLVMSLASAANTSIALCLGKLIDAVSSPGSPGLAPAASFRIAVIYLALIGGAYLARETMNVVRRFMVEEACTCIDRDMYVRVISHVMKVELTLLARGQVGALYGRINRSIEGLVRFLRISFLDFVPALFTGGFALAATLSKEPRIALAMAGVIPLSLGLTMWQLLKQNGVRRDLLRSRETMDGTVVEQLSGLDYIRASNTHDHELQRVAQTADRRRRKELRYHVQISLFGSARALNEGFFHVVVLALAIYLFVHGRLHAGEILAYSVLYLSVMAPLNEVHRFIDEAHDSGLKVADLVGLLEEPVDPSFEVATPAEPCLKIGQPVVVCRDLKLEYPTARDSGRPVLDGVNVVIHHGQTVGVAGRSGTGKSTWLRTLMRLAHPSEGTALVGGVPLACLARQTIGELLGYVGQNPFVFAGTIAENIAYGCGPASEAEIRRAAELACIHHEIMSMPGQYQAQVAERGQNLSGGQKQRIALARVFLKNPPILILDEATSALDNISERLVQRALSAARADHTVILVAHRLTTLCQADNILVFDEGKIAESGTYSELVERNGVFADLVRSAGDQALSQDSHRAQCAVRPTEGGEVPPVSPLPHRNAPPEQIDPPAGHADPLGLLVDL
jgi:ATP-binding cassette, subfamily B, bacterial